MVLAAAGTGGGSDLPEQEDLVNHPRVGTLASCAKTCGCGRTSAGWSPSPTGWPVVESCRSKPPCPEPARAGR